MFYLEAELDKLDGETAVMRTIREQAIGLSIERSSPVVPIKSVEGMKEEYNQATLWVPIAYEYPTHVSIDHGNEFTGRDTLQTARYTFIGTVAARELLFPPDVMLSEIDPRELRRINKDFERVIGDFGAILKATLEYINLGSPAGTGEVFTTARLAVLENETEYGLLSKKNPSIYFTKA